MVFARFKRYTTTAITLAYHYRYRWLGIPVPRNYQTQDFWVERGKVWMEELARAAPEVKADHARMSALFVEELSAYSFSRLFDMGCGYGQRLKPLKEAFPDKAITGLDFSETMLQNARVYLAGLTVGLVQADATKMPFADATFDAAIIWSVLDTMPPEVMRGSLRELRRVLRGPLVCMEEDARRDDERAREEHALATWFFAHDFEREFAEAGFTLHKVYMIDDLHHMRYTVFVLESS